jgi:hypothetical protein
MPVFLLVRYSARDWLFIEMSAYKNGGFIINPHQSSPAKHLLYVFKYLLSCQILPDIMPLTKRSCPILFAYKGLS